MIQLCNICYICTQMNEIYKCPLFASLDREEVNALLVQNSKALHYSAGQLIAKQSDTYRSLLCMDEGIVRGEMTHSNGERIIIEEIAAPRMIAPAFFFATHNTLPVDIIAKTSVNIIAISKGSFLTMLQKEERVLHNFLRQISDRSQFLSERLRMMRFGTIQSKLAHYLCEQMQVHRSPEFALEHTQQELADLFGVTRPAVARSLSILVEKNILLSKNRKIQILNREELYKLL